MGTSLGTDREDYYESVRLIQQVLVLYYEQGLTQAEVGQRLGLSTVKVHRLIQQARQQGMVEITIRVPFQHLFELEEQLQGWFGLAEAYVISAVPPDNGGMAQTLGRMGARVLLQHLHDGQVIGVGGGTGVSAVVEALSSERKYDVQVVPCFGAMQGPLSINVSYLAAQLAERLGGKSYLLNAPGFVENRAYRDALLAMSAVSEVLEVGRRADVALLGVGTADEEHNNFVACALSPAEREILRARCDVAGELGGYFFNVQGERCLTEFDERTVGLTLDELDRIPLTIGVAATAAKARPIYGALAAGLLDVLVTDEAAARGVAELYGRDHPGADEVGGASGTR